MRKTVSAILAALLVCLPLSACKGTEPPKNTDATTSAVTEPKALPRASEIAQSVAKACSFSEPISENDTYLSHHIFDFASLAESYTDSAAIIPTGITPEEVLVFIAADEKGANLLCDKLEAYVEYQCNEYGDYKPSEVPKLDGAVVACEGSVVIYVVSMDNDAAAAAAEAVLSTLK